MIVDPPRTFGRPRCQWRGRLGYAEALAEQREARERRQRGEIGDTLWLLEHDPVITTGRRVVEDLPSPARRAELGYALVGTERGGLATCHEPGQLVGYLLIDAGALGPSRTVAAVEQGLIDWLAARAVHATRRPEHPGVWVEALLPPGPGAQEPGEPPRWMKIAAIGLHFRAGFTMHGFALNLTNPLTGFGLITPCGVRDGGVTSLERLLGSAPDPASVALEVGDRVISALVAAGLGGEAAGGGGGLAGESAPDRAAALDTDPPLL